MLFRSPASLPNINGPLRLTAPATNLAQLNAERAALNASAAASQAEIRSLQSMQRAAQRAGQSLEGVTGADPLALQLARASNREYIAFLQQRIAAEEALFDLILRDLARVLQALR